VFQQCLIMAMTEAMYRCQLSVEAINMTESRELEL